MNANVGKPLPRLEDKRFMTGRGKYTDDVNIAGQTFARFVLSPHPHARIVSFNADKAKAMPGVVAVFSGEDLADIGPLICGWLVHSADGSPMNAGPHPALARGKVRYVGDHVALVVAETSQQADDAVLAVDVQYEPLPANPHADKAQNHTPIVHDEAPNNTCYHWEIGEADDVNSAFNNAAHTISVPLRNNRLIPNPMEPRAALADYNAGTDELTLYTTSQNPHVARLVLSAFCQVAPEGKLRVVAPDVGGGFGSKIFIYPEETACLFAAAKIKRPIKWTASRSDAFLCDAHGRDHHTNAELALDENGSILALRVKTIANMGAYLSTFASAVPTYLYATLLSGQYNIPAIHAAVDAVFTNTSPVDAYRGAGRPEAAFVVETLMDEAARKLNISPAEIRRKNFVSSFPHQTPVIMCYDVGDFNASLNRAAELAKLDSFPQRREEAASRGKLRGIGLSNYIEACGIAPSAAVGSLGAGVGLWESATVRVNPTGDVDILTGTHSHGQGHETTFAQLAADRLGIPVDKIRLVHGDTARIQFGMGTYGSRSAAVGLSALHKALDKIEHKAVRIASHLLEASPDDVQFKDGSFSVVGSDKSLAFAEVALSAYTAHGFPSNEIEPGLEENAFYDPANFTFPAGCHICEVEIDPDTGETSIVNFVAVDDFGVLINPLVVEGQVHGGVAQGVGQALLENAVYDDDAQLLSGSFMDYAMPRADDLPSFSVDFTTTPCPSNPIGVKGCGEAGAIAAPAAVMNAVHDAVGKAVSMPATPEKIWRSLHSLKPPP